MRILLIHVDHFEYQVKEKALKEPEPISEVEGGGFIKEALVCFCTVEKGDDANPRRVAENASETIEEVARSVKAGCVVLYPYAHLSSNLASSVVAIPLLKSLEEILKAKGFSVVRTPFGWYKSFKLSCKGHPLSELSRTITATQEAEKPPEVEEKPSRYLILEPNGVEHEIDLGKIGGCRVLESHPLLKQFILVEEVGGVQHGFPPHVKLMKRLELVDYEPASDIGHFRFYPKGTLIKELFESFADEIATEKIGAMRIETPMFYRLSEPDIAEHASKFLQKDYRFNVDGQDFTVRFAGDFGLFRIMREATMSYRQLPVRVYELSQSFRLEKSGECMGLKRLRAFTMPDVHCFCMDLKQGMDEFARIFNSHIELSNSMEISYAVAFRVVEKFYEENRDWIAGMLKKAGKAALVELMPEMKHYWVAKSEVQAIDSVGGNAQLCTVQLDVEDSDRYGIYYVAQDGAKRGCIIIHSSMGSVERWIYAVLEEAEKMRIKGKPPMLPVWLSPTQVRFIPVSREFLEYAVKVAEQFREKQIRVDVDDREGTVASKVREAEVEWIPYIVVVGEKEAKENSLTARVRGEGLRKLSSMELMDEVESKVKGKPKAPSPMPMMISMRPKFI